MISFVLANARRTPGISAHSAPSTAPATHIDATDSRDAALGGTPAHLRHDTRLHPSPQQLRLRRGRLPRVLHAVGRLLRDHGDPAVAVSLTKQSQANATEAVIGAIYTDAGLEKARKVTLKLWQKLLKESSETPRDPKSALQEWAQQAGHATPTYRHISREGPDHAPVFTVTVMVEGHQPLPGIGNSKQVAEREAARAMLAAIGGLA